MLNARRAAPAEDWRFAVAQTIAAIILTAWIIEAVAVGYAMARRGFDQFAWTAIAIGIGPIVLPFAFSSNRKPEIPQPTLVHAGGTGDGEVDVLVGIDGSPESAAALRHAQTLLGSRVGRLTLAHVIPIDAGSDAEKDAMKALAEAASKNAKDATQLVLRGRPVDALRNYADRLGYELLAVGTRGHGETRSLIGSVATGLARGTGVPVLLVDADESETRTNGRERAVAR